MSSIAKIGYIPSGYLNSAASATATGSTDAETGLPISTGLTLGLYQTFTDAEAKGYSNPKAGGVASIAQTAAGVGMTPGTYALVFTGGGGTGAAGTVTVSATALTSYSITNTGTGYTSPPAVTAATGGTPLTMVSTIYNQLFSGSYMWVQLDPAVTGLVPVGTPLYWLQTSTGYVVTTATASAADFAGVSIDPNFGASLPNAFVQQNGKTTCLFGATAPTNAAGIGDVVNISGTPFANFTAITAGSPNGAVTQLTVGYALAAGAANATSLVRVTRAVVRY